MPVTGTPGLAPTQPCCPGDTSPGLPPSPVTCDAAAGISAKISQSDRQPLFTRLRSITLTQSQVGNITWQLYDSNSGTGAPIDLSGCGFASDASSLSESSWGEAGELSVEFRMRDDMAANCRLLLTKDVQVVDPAQGLVAVELDPGDTDRPGVFVGEFALVKTVDGRQHVLVSNQLYVIINRSNWGGNVTGPPSLPEIRLALRDSSPGENLLLANLKFDDAEIAAAISRPIDYWNEVPPHLDNYIYTTSSFPYRFHWLEAICGLLFQIAAEQFRANQLDYQAAGVAVNDKNKEVPYEQAGMRRWGAWKDWVRAKKASLNVEQLYGRLGSDYGVL